MRHVRRGSPRRIFQRLDRDGRFGPLQSALAERGFDPARSTGLFGRRDRRAFAAYAESRGLETDPTDFFFLLPRSRCLAELVDETPI